MGCHLPLLAICRLRKRALHGGRRRQLAAAPHRATAIHPHPRPAGPRSVRGHQWHLIQGSAPMSELSDEDRNLVRLEVDGPVAVITNNRPEKHNAMSDEMDRRLWEALGQVHEMPGLRAIVWRGERRSFASGRDTAQLGLRVEDISDLEFIERGHRPTQMFLTMPCPIICALKGWVIGGAFE